MDATAQKKFSCPSCGGEAQWNPAKKGPGLPLLRDRLRLPRPNSTPPARRSSWNMIWSPPCAAFPMTNAAGRPKKSPSNARVARPFPSSTRSTSSQRCDFCGSTAFVPYEEIKDAFRPESLLPMKIERNQVRDSIRRWYGTRWFAPNRLKDAALTDTVKGLYIPYWTFDAQVHADWTAESGYYYYVTETLPRRQRPHPDTAGAENPLGAQQRRAGSFFRR